MNDIYVIKRRRNDCSAMRIKHKCQESSGSIREIDINSTHNSNSRINITITDNHDNVKVKRYSNVVHRKQPTTTQIFNRSFTIKNTRAPSVKAGMKKQFTAEYQRI